MKDWIAYFMSYVFSNWQNLLVGGAIVVGAVIFLMGVFKKALINRVKNKLLRKVILSFLSIILVFPATLGMVLYKRLDMSYVWIIYSINAISTILIYWLYENTGLRNLLSLIGKNTVVKLVNALNKSEKTISAVKETLVRTMDEIEEETKSSLKKSKYEEDDLNNL